MTWNGFEMESSVHTSASADAVWAVLRDVSGWPRWADVCWAASVDDTFDWRVGQRLRFLLRMAHVLVRFDVELSRSEPPFCVAWRSTEFTITATRTLTIQPAEPGAIIRDHKKFRSPVLPIGLAYPRFLIRRMTESWLRDLAAEAERRESD